MVARPEHRRGVSPVAIPVLCHQSVAGITVNEGVFGNALGVAVSVIHHAAGFAMEPDGVGAIPVEVTDKGLVAWIPE